MSETLGYYSFNDTTQNSNAPEGFPTRGEETAKITPKSVAIPKNITQKTVVSTQDFTNSKERCHGNQYGENCTQACPANCAGDGSCYKTSGECTLGCAPGHYSGKCDKECVNCVDKTCHQNTRQCMAGCMPGFTGLTCTETNSSQSYAVIYITVAVCLVLLLVTLLFVAYKYRRHRARVKLARETRFIQRANENMDDLNFLVARLSLFQSPTPQLEKVEAAPQGGESDDSESEAEDA